MNTSKSLPSNQHRRAELKQLVMLHAHDKDREEDGVTHGVADTTERLHWDEATIIRGALEMTDKTVKDILIPTKDVYSIDKSQKLTTPLVR